MTTVANGPVVRFASRTCGRCGGTGRYNVAVQGVCDARKCWACSGAGFLMHPTTRRHRRAFAEWQKAERPSLEAVREAIKAGRFGRSVEIVEAES